MYAPAHMYPNRGNGIFYPGSVDYNMDMDYMREEDDLDRLASGIGQMNMRSPAYPKQRGGHPSYNNRGGGYHNARRGGGHHPNNRSPGGPRVCKFFLQNKCTRGPSCNFAHIIPTLGMWHGGMNSTQAPHIPNNSPAPHHNTQNHPVQHFAEKKMWHGNMNSMQGPHIPNNPPVPHNAPNHPVQHFAGMSPNDSYGRNQDPTNDYMMNAQIRSVEDIQGRVYAMSRTQNGCRTLQRLMERNDNSWRVIYAELEQQFSALVTDPFGHHLCLRLLDYINTDQFREDLLKKLKEDLVAVSLSVHGTRVIQKVLEMMQTPTELTIVEGAMSMFVITLAKDVYGMHVILRCLHRIPPPSESDPEAPNNQFIFNEITKNIVSVATHKHGCCVVQWCIDYATPSQRQKLVGVIVQNSLELSQDAFGNYVVQQIMDPTHTGVLQQLVSHLQGSITKLAVQKFSSIVIEKCLEYTEAEQQMKIIRELVNRNKLPRLLQDPYANYVIQKALSVTRNENFQEVVSLIRPHLDALSDTPFGKRIKTQMIRRFPILSMGPKQTYGAAKVDGEEPPADETLQNSAEVFI